jgi:hypothetical protein
VTWDVFKEQMARLDGLKFRPSSLQTHWEALKDMPDVLLSAAIEKARDEYDEFPSPKMLKACADRVRARVLPLPAGEDRSTALPAPVTATLPTGLVIPFTREWKYYCERCSDSGWVSWWCGDERANRQPWIEPSRCQRVTEHGAHEWVGLCACAESNPAVLRKKETQLRMATQRVEKGRAS